jgi:hypothetical protein
MPSRRCDDPTEQSDQEIPVMSNAEHVALLRQGTDIWNAWRGENPSTRPDLAETTSAA